MFSMSAQSDTLIMKVLSFTKTSTQKKEKPIEGFSPYFLLKGRIKLTAQNPKEVTPYFITAL